MSMSETPLKPDVLIKCAASRSLPTVPTHIRDWLPEVLLMHGPGKQEFVWLTLIPEAGKKEVDLDAMNDLTQQLAEALEESGAGEQDGQGMATNYSYVNVICFGPDADALMEVFLPILKNAKVAAGGWASIIYGFPHDSTARTAVVTW